MHDLRHLSPPVLSGFVIDLSRHVVWSSVRNACGILHVFLGYLYRERILPKDLSSAVEAPQTYRLAKIPRSITWDEVRRLLEAIDRRTPTGRRDYAIVLLLVTYGLRAREVAALTLDDIDWRKNGSASRSERPGTRRPTRSLPSWGRRSWTTSRTVGPRRRIDTSSSEWSHLSTPSRRQPSPHVPPTTCTRSASPSRAGSHTLRHTCVQRLVDAEFDLKVIGDYVGHRSTASTEIYTKVAIETLREVACGDGEEVL